MSEASTDDQAVSDKQQRLLEIDEALRVGQNGAPDGPAQASARNKPFQTTTESVDDEADLARLKRSLDLLYEVSREHSSATDALDLELPRLPQRYQIIRRLGQGGFGIVVLAQDLHLNRPVALKLPRGNVLLTKSMVQRFLREAQHVAQLDHPNIVKVLGTDETAALPMIIYAYCNGPTLAEWVMRQTAPVPIAVAVRIATVLSGAIQHAHRRGIIHRDLKPTNILLESSATLEPHGFQDGDQYWIPRITDFGISKDATQTGSDQTTVGTVLGTIEYMAPEQIQARSADIGWHSDVYSLGVVLYEILTRSNPFTSDNSIERLLQMRKHLPLVRRLRPGASRDLEAVVAKCLQPEIDQRYATAQELLDDLRNVSIGIPVSVRPVSLVYRAYRWAQYQPLVAALSGVCVGLVILAIALLVSYIEHERKNMRTLLATNSRLTEANQAAGEARQKADDIAAKLADQLYSADMQAAADALRSKDMISFQELIERQRTSLGPTERDLAFDYLAPRGRRSGERLTQLDCGIVRLRLSNDGRAIALATTNGTLHEVDARTGQTMARWKSSDVGLTSCAYSPDDKRVAASAEDGFVTVWDRESDQPVSRFEASKSGPLYQVEWLNDDELVVSGDENHIRIWNWRSQTELAELKHHTQPVRALGFDPIRKQIVSGGDDHRLAIWNSLNHHMVFQPHATSARIRDVSIASHRQWIYTCDVDGVVRKHCAYEDPIPISELARARQVIECVAVGTNENLVAFGSREGVIQCVTVDQDGNYALEEFQRIGQAWLAHHGPVTDLVFSTDGQHLYSVGIDGSVVRWPANQGLSRRCDVAMRLNISAPGDLTIAEYEAEKCLLASFSRLFVWNPASDHLERLGQISGRAEQLLVHPELDSIVVAYSHGVIQAFDKQQPIAGKWSYHAPGSDSYCPVDFCPRGGRIAVSIREPYNRVVLLDCNNGQTVDEFPLPAGLRDNNRCLRFSPDGLWLAVGIGKTIYLWNLDSRELKILSAHAGTVSCVNFSHDSHWLASGSEDRNVLLWDMLTHASAGTLRYHQDEITSVLFSPDDRSILSTDRRGGAAVWSLRTRTLSMMLDSFKGQSKLPLVWAGPWLFRQVSGQTIIADHVEPAKLEF